jgi:hypothetical protein
LRFSLAAVARWLFRLPPLQRYFYFRRSHFFGCLSSARPRLFLPAFLFGSLFIAAPSSSAAISPVHDFIFICAIFSFVHVHSPAPLRLRICSASSPFISASIFLHRSCSTPAYLSLAVPYAVLFHSVPSSFGGSVHSMALFHFHCSSIRRSVHSVIFHSPVLSSGLFSGLNVPVHSGKASSFIGS